MDILVTGGAGQLGTELAALTWPAEISLHRPDRRELDLADSGSVARAVTARRYAAILSVGAYTAVDGAESDVAAAWSVNALAPAILAKAAAGLSVPIVHVSTDYVFDGSKAAPYAESDPVAPLGVYGASKEGGEQAVRTGNPRHAIIRTAWLVSPHRANFVKTMLRLADDRDEVSVVSDQRGCPTAAGDLAKAVRDVTLALMRDVTLPGATYHFAGAGEASWSEFATAIFAASARRGGPSARVRPITTAEYPTPAARPANSRLATARIALDFGIVPRPWEAAIDEIVAALVSRSR